MPFTDEQAKSIKEQIFRGIENFPENKREQIKQYVNSMNNEELEQFLIKNKMIQGNGEEQNENQEQETEGEEQGSQAEEGARENKKPANQCIYCMISSKQIESLALYEDKEYLAVLEINPYSEGHVILIPKQHLTETKKLKSKALTIANKIGKHLVKKLKAENYQITTSDDLKHAIINIIPIYKNQPLKFERKPAKKEHLNDLALKIGKIEKKTRAIKIKSEKKEQEEKKENNIEIKSTNMKEVFRRIP